MTCESTPEIDAEFFTDGGTLRPHDPSYVTRKADLELWDALMARHYCYVLTPRQMGKSSLMIHTATQLRKAGVATVVLDLTGIGTTNIDPEAWYLGQIRAISKQLRLTKYEDWWDEHISLGVVQRFANFITEVVLKEINSTVVIFVDEIDTTLNLRFSDDYFAAIRALFNERALNSDLQRLVFVLLGVASPSDLIKDSNRTPFNVGTRIQLSDFILEELQPYGRKLSPDPYAGKMLLKQIFYWTDGHPYLTQKICKEIAGRAEGGDLQASAAVAIVDGAVANLFLDLSRRNVDSNLRFVRDRVMNTTESAKFRDLYKRIRGGERLPNIVDPTSDKLKLAGLIKVSAEGLLTVRNRIYRDVFDETWLEREYDAQRPYYRSEFLKLLDSSFASLEQLKSFAMTYFGEIGSEIYSQTSRDNVTDVLLEYVSSNRLEKMLLNQLSKLNKDSLRADSPTTSGTTELIPENKRFEGGYHAFVAMPYGTKEGINFNVIFHDLIKPALESADFEVFRADEEIRAGNIRTDMFQELLLADLVVADLSIDNPNVWYELGVRHALRKRGVVQITCRRDQTPFDVLTERSVRYRIAKDSAEAAVPDPQYLEDDKKKLAEFAVQTVNSWYGRKVSPVYHLLPYLDEPDWKSLRVEEAKEFWEQYENWADRIEIARRGNRPGDILVFAEEAPTRVFHLEALQKAGRALLSVGQFRFALAQYEEALKIRPKDLESRRQKGLLLGLLKKRDDAKECIEDLVREFPDDAETWAARGRVEKDAWVDSWKQEGRTPEELRGEAEAESAILEEAINSYATGFRKDPAHYYSGINAVTLLHLLAFLSSDDVKTDVRIEMEGGVRWAIRGALEKDPKDYWARITLAELEVLVGSKQTVETAYRNAVAVADRDWFKLQSSRQQLALLRDLGLRPAEVGAGLAVMDRALSRLNAPDKTWPPRQVFLFSGHMIDAADRPEPRFPADKENIAAAAIAAKLDELGAGPEDLALCGGACGGDLLFGEACLARGLKLELRLAFDEPTFLNKSVSFAPGNWIGRYFKVKANPKTKTLIMPKELGPLPAGSNAFARANLWQLYTSLAWGPEKVRFVCLWNRRGGDGPGGTQHMYETVQKYSGRVYVIDTTTLW